MTDSNDLSSEEMDTILGVVEPPLFEGYIEQPEFVGDDRRPYERAHHDAVVALSTTRERIAGLRKQREEINAEIKQLVTDEVLLARMARITDD